MCENIIEDEDEKMEYDNARNDVFTLIAMSLFSIEHRILVKNVKTGTIHLIKSCPNFDMNSKPDIQSIINSDTGDYTFNVEKTECGRNIKSMIIVDREKQEHVTCKKCLKVWQSQYDNFPTHHVEYYINQDLYYIGINKYRDD